MPYLCGGPTRYAKRPGNWGASPDSSIPPPFAGNHYATSLLRTFVLYIDSNSQIQHTSSAFISSGREPSADRGPSHQNGWDFTGPSACSSVYRSRPPNRAVKSRTSGSVSRHVGSQVSPGFLRRLHRPVHHGILAGESRKPVRQFKLLVQLILKALFYHCTVHTLSKATLALHYAVICYILLWYVGGSGEASEILPLLTGAGHLEWNALLNVAWFINNG